MPAVRQRTSIAVSTCFAYVGQDSAQNKPSTRALQPLRCTRASTGKGVSTLQGNDYKGGSTLQGSDYKGGSTLQGNDYKDTEEGFTVQVEVGYRASAPFTAAPNRTARLFVTRVRSRIANNESEQASQQQTENTHVKRSAPGNLGGTARIRTREHRAGRWWAVEVAAVCWAVVACRAGGVLR